MKTVILNENEYFICFKNIIHSLKIFAIFPFVNFNEETTLSRLCSLTVTIISVGIFVVVNIKEGVLLYNSYFNVLRDFNFLNLMRYAVQTAVRTLILTFPLITWNKTEKLQHYWRSWMLFQIEIEKLTKTPFKSSTRCKIQGLFLFTTLAMVILCTLGAAQQRPSSLIMVNPFTLLYIFHALAYVTIYWIVNNMYTSGVAKKLTNSVQQALHKRNIADLGRLIHLWIMLCDLNDEFINIHSIMFLIMFSTVVINGTCCAYLAVASYVYLDDKSLALVYIYGLLVNTICMMIYCESANSVINKMVRELKNVLLSGNIQRKKNCLPIILLFLYTIETRKPKITFRGYMTINRSILSTILAAAINFLVVLKQFSPA